MQIFVTQFASRGRRVMRERISQEKRTRGILRRSTKLDENLVGSFIKLKSSCKNSNVIEKTMLLKKPWIEFLRNSGNF